MSIHSIIHGLQQAIQQQWDNGYRWDEEDIHDQACEWADSWTPIYNNEIINCYSEAMCEIDQAIEDSGTEYNGSIVDFIRIGIYYYIEQEAAACAHGIWESHEEDDSVPDDLEKSLEDQFHA